MAANPRLIAATLTAAGAALGLIAASEGWINVGYHDPVGIPTACAGHTGPEVVVGKRYTDTECAEMLAQDAVSHGLDIAKCLPDELPTNVRAAFTSYAFNIGATKFCRSSVAGFARAGDLARACAEFSNPKLATAKGKTLRGLVIRRANERKLCESGL
jgi:lysozyme